MTEWWNSGLVTICRHIITVLLIIFTAFDMVLGGPLWATLVQANAPDHNGGSSAILFWLLSWMALLIVGVLVAPSSWRTPPGCCDDDGGP